jgi:poly-beta-hydroxyalkanoate depolymerase
VRGQLLLALPTLVSAVMAAAQAGLVEAPDAFGPHLENTSLAKGTLQMGGRRIDCATLKDTALLTLEGAQDDMVAVGITEAAQGLRSNLPACLRDHHVQEGVRHYGVFNRSVCKAEIAPRMMAFAGRHGATAGARDKAARRSGSVTR